MALHPLSRVHNILSPLRHDRKPLIFQWAFTLRNAGIGSGSNPAFYTLKNEWLPVVTKRRHYIMNPPLQFNSFATVMHDLAVKFVQEVSTSVARFFAAESLLVLVSLILSGVSLRLSGLLA